ncbi:GntR family transcriptional regulator [Paenibacillus cymbidii]|uniref:GntR family transcriptional regulator n=1 Tax=Paenibacillus cymbidii TaxID=1639034 RepID=UPI001081EEB0|nr:GntR family transcriptional regulator [Paenibacillus cymbidii]
MAEFRFEEEKATSLRHKITDNIRRAIFQGKIKAGDRLREVEMSRQMGVSRGPIREAMRTLEQEGLLYSHPYKETTVAEITEEEVTEVLIPIRLTIEQFAMRKALPLLQAADLDRLGTFVEEMREGARQRDLIKMVDCDLAFHEYVVQLAGVPNLHGTWMSIYNRIRLHFIMQGQSYDDLSELCAEHEKLLATIAAGDPDAVAAALKVHIADSNFGFLRQRR